MSIERVERQDGSVVWRVRWRQAGHNRSKVLGRKRDAEAFDAELRRRKRRLGEVPLRELTPEVVNRFRLDLEADGVGRVSVRKALTLLHGVLQRACEWGRIAANPVNAVRKPPAGRSRAVTPLSPETVEAIRDWLLRRRLVRDATLVSVLAYAGLRPGEALALTWAHVRDRTILVEAAVSIGVISETKTRRRRTVRLMPALAHDLAEWQLEAGRPDSQALVFPGTMAGPGRERRTRTGGGGSMDRLWTRQARTRRARTISGIRLSRC